jgi:hypothetical protein
MIAISDFGGGRMVGFRGSPAPGTGNKFPPRTDGLTHDPWPLHASGAVGILGITGESGTDYGAVSFVLASGSGFYYAYRDTWISSGEYSTQGFPVNYTGEYFNFATRWTLISKIAPDQLEAWTLSH